MFNRRVYVDHLKGVPLFRACSAKDLRSLAGHADQISIESGATVVTEGDSGREFFVIVSGRAKVTRTGRKINELGPGDFFGELALLVDQPRTATVSAIDDLELVVLHRPDFIAALDEVPGMGTKLAKGLAERIAELDRRVV
jgi:CRP-like cAMP-binding protein